MQNSKGLFELSTMEISDPRIEVCFPIAWTMKFKFSTEEAQNKLIPDDRISAVLVDAKAASFSFASAIVEAKVINKIRIFIKLLG